MITPVARTTVSAALLATTLALGACARGPAPVTWEGSAASEESPLAIRFDNEAEARVDVYLVGEQREWWLGRVAPGAHTTLQIPPGARVAISGFVRLAVLPDAPISMRASRDPRAAITIAQPATELLSQKWTFSHPQMASAEIVGARLATGQQ